MRRRERSKTALLPGTRLRDETSKRARGLQEDVGARSDLGKLASPLYRVSSECWERNLKTCPGDGAKHHGKRFADFPLSFTPYGQCPSLDYSRKPWMSHPVFYPAYMDSSSPFVGVYKQGHCLSCLLRTVSAIHTLVSSYQSSHSANLPTLWPGGMLLNSSDPQLPNG